MLDFSIVDSHVHLCNPQRLILSAKPLSGIGAKHVVRRLGYLDILPLGVRTRDTFTLILGTLRCHHHLRGSRRLCRSEIPLTPTTHRALRDST